MAEFVLNNNYFQISDTMYQQILYVCDIFFIWTHGENSLKTCYDGIWYL